jgi:hypothetical protein
MFVITFVYLCIVCSVVSNVQSNNVAAITYTKSGKLCGTATEDMMPLNVHCSVHVVSCYALLLTKLFLSVVVLGVFAIGFKYIS